MPQDKMPFDEFEKKYMSGDGRGWKFELFRISCRKCGSPMVEFAGNMELDSGYYDDYSVEGAIIVKCHGCGNAMTLNFWDVEKK